jgi:hypothetical protein
VLGAGQWASGSADLLVRDTPAAGPALVRVDPRTGHQRPLGVLPDATPRGCWAQNGYLFCPRSLEKIGVWAVRG